MQTTSRHGAIWGTKHPEDWLLTSERYKKSNPCARRVSAEKQAQIDICLYGCPFPDDCHPESYRCPLFGQEVVDREGAKCVPPTARAME